MPTPRRKPAAKSKRVNDQERKDARVAKSTPIDYEDDIENYSPVKISITPEDDLASSMASLQMSGNRGITPGLSEDQDNDNGSLVNPSSLAPGLNTSDSANIRRDSVDLDNDDGLLINPSQLAKNLDHDDMLGSARRESEDWDNDDGLMANPSSRASQPDPSDQAYVRRESEDLDNDDIDPAASTTASLQGKCNTESSRRASEDQDNDAGSFDTIPVAAHADDERKDESMYFDAAEEQPMEPFTVDACQYDSPTAYVMSPNPGRMLQRKSLVEFLGKKAGAIPDNTPQLCSVVHSQVRIRSQPPVPELTINYLACSGDQVPMLWTG